MKPSLSIIIITKNASKTIEKCLMSVSFANEIIVLDSGSTDNTVDLCRNYTAQVFQTDWPGFGIQKNRALEKATGDWIFSIDSDEWVTEALKNEILSIITTATYEVFSLPRQNRCCGHWMRFGDQGKDSVTRLFKRDRALFNNNTIHESLQTTAPIGHLTSPLLHDSFENLSQIIEKANRYSTLTAKQLFGKKKGGFFRGLQSGTWIFLRGYLFRLGFLDGRAGFCIAFGNFIGTFCKYAKLAELENHVKS
ncbi:MAG: glycosyltransferase family 2 protein [Coxiellaceae bacterium]|nr:glycosyltransferase family 2 protein [Coxiellaceae bacterium]